MGLYHDWTPVCSIFLKHNETFWTAYEFSPSAPITLTAGIDAILSTFLADTTLVRDLSLLLRESLLMKSYRYGVVGLSGAGRGVLCSFRWFALP